MIPTRLVWRSVLCAFCWVLCGAAHAWGPLGHQIVASLAHDQLTPKSRERVQRLLAGESMAEVSTWADEHRTEVKGSLHYVNFPRGTCVYDARRDCPDGQCVVKAIEQQLAVLRSTAGDAQKQLALKLLIHFVADVHQPLHAGHSDDRGGNNYQLQVFGHGSNLHAFWDTGVLKHKAHDVPAWVGHLSGPVSVSSLSPVDMAQASCQIVADKSFYPGRSIDRTYAARWEPVAEQQLKLGGARLALLLNEVLGR